MPKNLTLRACFIALLGLVIALAGCSSKEAEAETFTCSGCSQDFPQKDAQIVANKMMCAACAAKSLASGPDQDSSQQDMQVCSVCGMKMGPEDMVEIDGKIFCSHCIPASHTDEGDAGEHQHDHDSGQGGQP